MIDASANEVQHASFVDRLQANFRPGYKHGTVQLRIGPANMDVAHVHIGTRIDFRLGPREAADCTVSMPEPAYLAMVRDGLEPQPESVRIEGDRDLAALLLLAIRGADTPGRRRLQQLEQSIAAQRPYDACVERIGVPTAGGLLRMLQRGRPAVIEGALADGAWTSTPAAFLARFGEVPITSLDAEVLGASTHPTRVGDLMPPLDHAAKTLPVYSGGCALPGPMLEHFHLPLLKTACFTHPKLWMGTRAKTRLHRDFLHAFVGQVWGVKRFVLFPPDDAPWLHCGACFEHFQLALFDPLVPGNEAAASRRVDLELGPGELLVLPAGWFHAVTSDEPVMSVNCFMREEAWNALAARLA